MIHPIPPGTRDVLPDEMRELRRLERALSEVFEARGYGEVRTPTIEYDEVLARGELAADAPGRGPVSSHRFFDESGELLAMRSDMTLPIARLVSDRYGEAELPLRLYYIGNAFRAVTPQRGQMREFRQAGVELIGLEAPAGTVEVVSVLSAALDAAELDRAVIGLGDANLYLQLLRELGVDAGPCEELLASLANHDFVGLETQAAELDLDPAARAALVAVPGLRGDASVLDRARELGGEAAGRAIERLAVTYEALEQAGVADRVQLDLGLLRDLGYYSGAIVEVYDPALGHIIGGGGRYDELMGRFGRPLPAAGFALYMERLHIAQAEEGQ